VCGGMQVQRLRSCRTSAEPFRAQVPMFRRRVGPAGRDLGRWAPRRATADPAMGGGGGTEPEAAGQEPQVAEQDFQVFPRIRERDPFRKLGVQQDASFEEIQAARNFLVEQYKWHEASRESIEMSFEKILALKMADRHKHGFRPPSTGRKSDVQGEAEPTNLGDRVKEALEPDLPLATIVNEGVIYLALAIWAGVQSVAADPILPLGLGFGFAAYKIFDKRNKRNPDASTSPLWGALGMAVFGIFLGFVLGLFAVRLPLPAFIQPQSFAVAMIPAMCGVVAVCFK